MIQTARTPLPRRQLIAGLAWLPLLGLAAAGHAAGPLGRAGSEPRQARRLLMGTWVTLRVADGRQPGVDEAIAAAFGVMDRLAGEMSRFTPDSRVAQLNQAAGREALPVSAEMLGVLQAAQRVSALSGGAFDVTVGRLTRGPGGLDEHEIPDDITINRALRHIKPQRLKLDLRRRTAYIDDALTQIDLGGIAKLPILEAGLNEMARRGMAGVLIDGGGDVLCSARADGLPWHVGLRNPAQPERLLAVLPLRAGVVASSGDYERFTLRDGRRWHHIVDPHSGRPSRGVHGVSLVAERAAQLNGLGTAAMVAGLSSGAALLQRAGVGQALMMGDDGRLWISPALAQRLQPAPGDRDAAPAFDHATAQRAASAAG